MNIIELARQAGMDTYGDGLIEATSGQLQHFANLVIEECVKVIEAPTIHDLDRQPCECAAAIREMKK